MRRRRLDLIVSSTGIVLTLFLVIAGALLLWGRTFARSTVTDQLSQQKIAFDSNPANLPPSLAPWVGVQVNDGPSAKAYSDMIAIHIAEATGRRSYSEVSGQWFADGRPGPAADQNKPTSYDLRMTAFMGETLRGLLLNAYAYWTVGTVLVIAGWVVLLLALVMLILTILGFVHARRVSDHERVLAA